MVGPFSDRIAGERRGGPMPLATVADCTADRPDINRGYKQRGENVSYITYAKRSNGRKKKPGDHAGLSTLIKDQRPSLIR